MVFGREIIKRSIAKQSILGMALILACVYMTVYFSVFPDPELNLAQLGWRACIPSHVVSKCEFADTIVPRDANRFSNDFVSDISYEVSFPTPDYCKRELNVCTLYISEVGDAARVYLNGRLIGQHGAMPPHGIYAKHYPLRITLPHSGLHEDKENRLTFDVHSFKRAQSGIRKGPIGIFSEANAFYIARVQVAQTIVLPLMSAFALFLIGLTALTWAIHQGRWPRDIEALVLYCGFVGTFLLSFTEIIREIIPVHWAGLAHHTLRLLGDLFFFQLIRVYFFPSAKIWQSITILYWVVIAICPLAAVYFYFSDTLIADLFDNTYLVRRIALPLLVLPHILGIWGAYRSPRSSSNNFLMGVFILTAAFQINDSLIFHAIMSGTYLIKAYPVLIAISLGYLIFRRHAEEAILREAHFAADALIGRVTRQAAHDIRSPVSALLCAASIVQTKPEEAAALIKTAANRVDTIAQDLLNFGAVNDASKRRNQSSDILNLVRELIVEKRGEHREHKNVEILEVNEGDVKPIQYTQDLDIARILSNLINNSVEASNGKNKIIVGTSVGKGTCSIYVQDSGHGIQPDILNVLNSENTFARKTTKASGNGLALQSAKSDLNRIGGSLQIESRIGVGTKVTIRFPIN